MNVKGFILLVFSLIIILVPWGSARYARSEITALQNIQVPTLKWQRGGCYNSWCETGWYASPAVADIDGDGELEVIGSAYSIVSLDGVATWDEPGRGS
jgi:hypothetical protein